MTIEESNKLIAEFMGMKQDAPHSRWYDSTGNYHFVHELKYHSSWGWLMPVLRKIEKTKHGRSVHGFNTAVTNSWCAIASTDDTIDTVRFQELAGLGTTKIEATYKVIIAFIEWYNEKQKS